MAGSTMTDGSEDIYTKYAAFKDVTIPTGSVADRERTLAEETNDAGSVTGFLMRGMETLENELVGHLTAGRALDASNAYERLNKMVDDNLPGIAALASLSGGGAIAQQVSERARRATNHAYNAVEFSLPDGRKATIGQYFTNPDMFGDPGKAFKDNGFRPDIVDDWLSGKDPVRRRAMNYYLRSADVLRSSAPDRVVTPNYEQLRQGASAVYDNWEGIYGAFGAASDEFSRRIAASNLDVGGFDRLVPALVKVAESRKARHPGLAGHRLVAGVMDDFQRLHEFASQGAPGPDGTTRKVTQTQRLFEDATIVKALDMMEASGRDVDFSSPATREALFDCMSLMAQMTEAGYDVTRGGSSITDLFAEHVAKAGTAEARSGFVYNWLGDRRTPGFSSQLDVLVTGGADFRRDAVRSADPRDWTKVSQASGGVSSCPQADAIAAGVKDRLRVHVFPEMASGKTPSDAFAEIRGSFDRNTAMTKDVMSEIQRFIPDEDLARELAVEVIGSVASGRSVNIQKLVADSVFSEDFARDYPRAARVARDWYYGAVTSQGQFPEEWALVRAHLRDPDGYGLDDRRAQAMEATMYADMAKYINESQRAGVEFSPRAYLLRHLDNGYYYAPVVSKGADGKPLLDANGQPTMVVVRQRTDKMSAVREAHDRQFGFGSFDIVNRELRGRYETQEALRHAEEAGYASSRGRKRGAKDGEGDQFDIPQ